MTASISLDGPWEFLYVADDRQVEPVKVRTIQVPGPWQAQFSDLRMRAGIGIYRRTFEVPAGWKNGRILLRFGAVFHNTRVWLNGAPVGDHQGGFLPFAFDVSEYVVEGQNEVKVRVESPTDNPAMFPETPFAEIPFGKQSWYGPLSGIWQSVSLERRAVDHVSRVRIQSDLATGRVRATLFFDRAIAASHEVHLTIKGPDGHVVAEVSEAVVQGDEELAVVMSVPDMRAWSPDKPNLYELQVELHDGAAPFDRKVETFGFRTIETRGGRLYLNGEPIYLRAALDQDYYPDTICTVPSEEFLEDQFRKAKELGLNCLRCHIKAADPRYYAMADRIGLLIWTELPNGGLSTERSRRRKEKLLKGIVDRDGNHPCIVIWTIINENWGVDLVHDADHRSWLRSTYHWLKGYDPTRLVVDNSPLAPSFHVETDIADYHFYAAFPDNRRAWDDFVDELANRSPWLYSSEGDAVIRGDEPVMCSEFGNWGLPHPEDLHDAQGREPWWFETGHDWGEGIMYAHGIENRFVDWSLERVFGSLSRFIEAAQWQQYRALKYEIEMMRRRPEPAGYVITEFTDAHWESNGLLDMRRNRRVFHDIFHRINADTVIVPRWERLSYWAGETMIVELSVSHGAGPVLEGGRLEISVEGMAPIELRVPTLAAGEVAALGHQRIELPTPAKARRVRVGFRLDDGSGRPLARNELELAVFPETRPAHVERTSVWSPEVSIRDRMRALGYPLADDLASADVIVSTKFDKELVSHVRAGGRLLYLPEAEGALYPFFPHWQNVKVQARGGTPWAGDWASSFAWLLRQGPFADIPGAPMIDETFDRVIPRHVISGCNLLDFQSRVHAGLVVGWIHKPVALLVERTYGLGRFAASTFRLMRDPAGSDPMATALLHRLVGLVAERTAASIAHEGEAGKGGEEAAA
jgi:hypothetical protein